MRTCEFDKGAAFYRLVKFFVTLCDGYMLIFEQYRNYRHKGGICYCLFIPKTCLAEILERRADACSAVGFEVGDGCRAPVGDDIDLTFDPGNEAAAQYRITWRGKYSERDNLLSNLSTAETIGSNSMSKS